MGHRAAVDARGQAESSYIPLAHRLPKEPARGVSRIRRPPWPAFHSAPHHSPQSLQRKAGEAEAGLGTLAAHPQARPKQAPQSIILFSPSRHLPHQLIKVNQLA